MAARPGLEPFKRQAAACALEHVRSGMRLGLGTGSTARYFIEGLAERLARGELTDIVGVATSEASEALARRLRLPTGDLDERPLDLAVDGVDELDPRLDAIKGLGGALAREKLVERRAERLIFIADESKRVARLGETATLPVEVLPFGWRATRAELEQLGLEPRLRHQENVPFLTDNHNYILDCRLPQDFAPQALATAIALLPGVLEHGFFLGMAERAYLAGTAGVSELRREELP